MNLVERWFAELTNKWLRRGTHRSTKELEASINNWINTWNDDPKPFIWHKSADEILDTLATYVPAGGSPTHDTRERARAGLEPARPFGQRLLRPPRLPFRHPGENATAYKLRSTVAGVGAPVR